MFKFNKTRHHILSIVSASLLLVGTTSSPVWADTDEMSRDDRSRGDRSRGDETISELAAAWWQWAYLNGFPDQGAFGEGFIDCSAGQDDEDDAVWFLAGKGEDDFDPTLPPGEQLADRTCLEPIPSGTRLFFPLVNFAIFNPDELCFQVGDLDGHCTVAEKREVARGIVSDAEPGVFNTRACFLTAAVDGRPIVYDGISFQRTQSPPFGIAEEAMITDDKEAITDGLWVLLPELKDGEHTIDFTGAFCLNDGFDIVFGSQVTYKLTIEDD